MKELKVVKNPKTLDGLKVVNDYEEIAKYLSEGETVAHFEWGDSMNPILVNGQYCRLVRTKETPQVGDAVFCRVNGYLMTHMVLLSNRHTGQCLISSTSGSVYGWTDEILGLAIPMPYIEDDTSDE